MTEGVASPRPAPAVRRSPRRHGQSDSQAIERLLSTAGVLGSLYVAVRLHGLKFDTRYALLGILACLFWVLMFNVRAVGRSRARTSRREALGGYLAAWGGAVIMLMVVGYVLKVTAQFSRVALTTWVLFTPILLWLVRVGTMAFMDYRHARGQDIRHAVLAPWAPLGMRLAEELKNDPGLGVEIAGYFDDRSSARDGEPGLTRLGSLAQLADYVRGGGIDLVYLVVDQSLTPQLEAIMQGLEGGAAAVVLLPDLFTYYLLDARLESLNGIPLLAVGDVNIGAVGGVAKRLMDLLLASTALVLAAPLLAGIALAIKLDSPGPVLFRQRRYGLNGDEIHVYKFRSMQCLEDGSQVSQVQRADPRVTRVGAVLRKSSLDEVPQLINVIRGSMSLVGPRPHAVAHNEFYRTKIGGYMLRHKVRPGMTGWAQINGCRGETDTLDKMQKRLDFDLDYIRRWSPWLDVSILVKTIPKLFPTDEVY